MKLIVNGFMAFALAVSATAGIATAVLPNKAQAYSASDALMIIRFNQKVVAYQDQLFYVVSQAVKTKPTVIFEVVGVSQNGQSYYGQQVANDIARIGVNPAQITFRTEASQVSSEEVRIFVR